MLRFYTLDRYFFMNALRQQRRHRQGIPAKNPAWFEQNEN